MIYANGGYFHVDDPVNPTSLVYKYAGYEGVRSFAIVTTKVTDDILQCWLDQKDRTDVNGTLLYPDGPMKAAYGTFLEALLMIKCHDMVADQAASQYNVSWTRTTPIIVSVFDDAYRTVLTLECSHRFGMDVIGDVSNITAFRYACSSAINPIEHMVGESLFPGGNSTSIVMGLGQMIFNGEMVDLFMSNGYFVMKSADNTLFLVLDPETGILRDVMVMNSSLSGNWCYSDQQAEWAYNLGEKLDNSNPGAWPSWLNYVSMSSIAMGTVLVGSGEMAIPASIIALASNPVGWVIGFAIVDAYLLWNYPDIAVPANLKSIPIFGQVLALYSLQSIIRGEGEPLTPERLKQSCLGWASTLMAIAEDEDEESFDELNEMLMGYPHSHYGWATTDEYSFLNLPPRKKPDTDFIDVADYIRKKLNKSKEKWNNGDKIGAIKEFKWVAVGTGVIILEIISTNKNLIGELIKSVSKGSTNNSGSGGGGGGAF